VIGTGAAAQQRGGLGELGTRWCQGPSAASCSLAFPALVRDKITAVTSALGRNPR
jgi:hypothetical protein